MLYVGHSCNLLPMHFGSLSADVGPCGVSGSESSSVLKWDLPPKLEALIIMVLFFGGLCWVLLFWETFK